MKKFTDKTQLILDSVQADEQSIVMQANRYNQAQGAKVGNACNKLKGSANNKLKGSAKLYDQCVYGEIYKKKIKVFLNREQLLKMYEELKIPLD